MKHTRIKYKSILEYLIVFIGVFVFKAFTLQGIAYNLCAEDNSIFFIIGREMLNGKVLYKEITDQKGIYIFFIYVLANIISQTSQVGVYIIHSLLMCCVIGYLYNTLKIKISTLESMIITYFCIILICWTPVMTLNGYNEDFILLCYIASLISLYKHFDEHYSNYKVMVLHGVMCGIILNMKPNYILFYIPIAIHLIVTTLKDKKYITLRNNILSGLFGITVANIPMIIYTVYNKCFIDMIHELYGNNSFDMYAEFSKSGIIGFVRDHLLIMLLIMVASVVTIFIYKKSMTILYTSMSLFALVSALMSGRPYVHYTEVLLAFCIPTVAAIVHNLFKLKIKVASVIVCISIAYIAVSYQNIYTSALYNLYITEDANYGIYKIAELYRGEYSEFQDVVYIGYGGLMYYNTDIPVDKHPSLPCIQFDKYKDAVYYKENEIANNEPEMIVIQDGFMGLIQAKLSQETINIIQNNYTKVDEYLEKYNVHNCSFYIRNDLVKEG